MSAVWLTIAVLAVASAAIKATGPLLVGARTLSPRVRDVIVLLAPTLLAALVVVETFSEEGRLVPLDARVAGVAVAGLALALRAPVIVAIAVAAAATAGLRTLT